VVFLEESGVQIPNYYMSVLPSLQQCIIGDDNTLKTLSSFLLSRFTIDTKAKTFQSTSETWL